MVVGIGISRQRIGHVDQHGDGAHGLSQVPQIELGYVLARQHIERVDPQRLEQLALGFRGSAVIEGEDTQAHVWRWGARVERDGALERQTSA
ncbi:hypothetical protein EPN44_08990 [bacterium]|nr:MAG: hypothetical protein EPN44_08990 [bacterium]